MSTILLGRTLAVGVWLVVTYLGITLVSTARPRSTVPAFDPATLLAPRQAEEGSFRYVPVTVTLQERLHLSDGTVQPGSRQLRAVREDGAYVERFEYLSPESRKQVSQRTIMLPDGLRVILNEIRETKTSTRFPSYSASAQFYDPDTRCLRPSSGGEHADQRIDGSDMVLGYEAVRVATGRGAVWRAPALNCAIVRTRTDLGSRQFNDSARHISIAGIESGCYCTTALSSSEAIAPGAIGELVVTLDTSPFDGPTSKRISVRTSGGEAHTYSLEIRAHVVPEFTVSSRYIEFSSSEDIADRKEVVVTSEGGAAPAVAAARSTDPNVTVVLSSDPSDSRTVRITLTRLRPDRPVFGNLIVENTSQWEPELRIPLRGS
jgi:hypothetical protein